MAVEVPVWPPTLGRIMGRIEEGESSSGLGVDPTPARLSGSTAWTRDQLRGMEPVAPAGAAGRRGCLHDGQPPMALCRRASDPTAVPDAADYVRCRS
jgi:hypothetical protein